MGQGIRQTDTDNYLSPASTLDANADYTLMGWFRFATFGGGLTTTVPVLITNDDDSRYDLSSLSSGYRDVEALTPDDYADDSDTSTPPLDTWIHVAMVRGGADLSLWLDGVETFTATLDVSAAAPATKLAIGGWPDYDGYSVLGDLAACRAWSAALSGTEIAAEMASATAVRSSALWADWQMVGADETARLADSSGNARHLTRYGAATGTFEDGPEFADNTDDLTATGITTGAPTLGAPAIGQTHALTAQGVTTSAPTLGAPGLGSIVALSALGLSAGAPTLGSPALGQVHRLTPVGVTTGAPEFGPLTLGQAHALLAVGMAAGAPSLGSPALWSYGGVTPAERRGRVAAEDRIGTVGAETRRAIVAAESRIGRD